MKNLFLLPTDKASRIIKSQDNDFILLNTNVPNWFEINLNTTKQNIYITNDEEIKEGDYGVLGESILSYHQMHKRWGMPQGKKIILTTDADLVEDGVQAIPDDFLEWFVSKVNDSGKSIDIVSIDKIGLVSDNGRVLYGHKYKIVIPKEEPKLNLEKEMFELEQELDIPSHLRFHNSKTQTEIDEDYSGGLTMGQIIPKEEPKKKHKIVIFGDGLPKQGTMSEAIKQVINEHLQKEPNQSAVEFLVEQLQSQSFIPKDSIVINNFIKVAVELENQRKDKYATDFLDSIREYERENGSRICFDERDSKELLEIYKTGKDEIK